MTLNETLLAYLSEIIGDLDFLLLSLLICARIVADCRSALGTGLKLAPFSLAIHTIPPSQQRRRICHVKPAPH